MSVLVIRNDGRMTALDDAVAATLARMEALDVAETQQKIRHRAYLRMSREGLPPDQEPMSHRGISQAMVAALEGCGLTPEQIRVAGVSHDSVTLALKMVRGE